MLLIINKMKNNLSDLRRIEKEANKKNEILQAQITHICTFILKKFGVNSSTEKRDSCVKRTRIYRKFSKGLHTRVNFIFYGIIF